MAGSERSFSATSYAENCVLLAGVGNETQARDLLSRQRLSEEVVDIKQTSRGSRDCVVLFSSFSSKCYRLDFIIIFLTLTSFFYVFFLFVFCVCLLIVEN